MKYPRFISNAPCGEDFFDGKSQKKIAKIIGNLIENDKSCNIIGIDGGWGAGKSNLVKQVEKELSPKGYHFFIYDAWGHQEDLLRRSFLEELTADLKKNEIVDDSGKEKVEELLAKNKKTKSKRFPEISFGIIVIALLILVTPIFKLFSDKICNDLISFIVLALPMLLVFVIYISYFFKVNDERFINRFKIAFTKLFLEYQNIPEGLKIEMISEVDPSVREFRTWMSDISDKLNAKKLNLVLVFDNMDRLPQKKVQELWSSIHVFFCENPYPYESIKVIVPFDRKHINLTFQSEGKNQKRYGDDFINKTFNIVYRVSPPILSDWKNYFSKQWNEAFGENDSLSNINDVIQIFELLCEDITPRKIIAFINELVSIKLIVKDSIPNNYIALFILGKNTIVKNPFVEITTPSYLKGLSYLYSNDEELPKYMAALFYQVEPEKAIQIVFTSKIVKALNENNLEDLKTMIFPQFCVHKYKRLFVTKKLLFKF